MNFNSVPNCCKSLVKIRIRFIDRLRLFNRHLSIRSKRSYRTGHRDPVIVPAVHPRTPD